MLGLVLGLAYGEVKVIAAASLTVISVKAFQSAIHVQNYRSLTLVAEANANLLKSLIKKEVQGETS